MKMVEEIFDLDTDTPAPVLDILGLKLMAMQTKLMSDILNELGGIERCLERIASRLP